MNLDSSGNTLIMNNIILTKGVQNANLRKSSGKELMSIEAYRLLTSHEKEKKKKKSKYNAKKTEIDGINFDSIGESKRYMELKVLERIGDIFDLKLQLSHKLIINGDLICTYRSDFEYFNREGVYVVEDFKGFRTPEYKIKRNLMKALKGIVILETGCVKGVR